MSERPTVTIMPQNLTLEAAEGESLHSVLARAGLPVGSHCGGRGICGKCKVRISGTAPQPSVQEYAHLSSEELAEGVRLACCTIPEGGETVECPDAPSACGYKLQIDTLSFPVNRWSKKSGHGVVLAVDLGTTNVVGHAIDPYTGRVVASSGRENSQSIFGADVMTRLAYASSHGLSGRETLQRAALSDIEKLFEEMKASPPVTDIVAVMNTAMEVLLLGLDPDLLGRYPCNSGIAGPVHITPPFTSPRLKGARLHVPPVIGGFVGSDTVGALLAVETLTPDPPYVLLDIGTNAEVVVVMNEHRVACSTAAGPAFEGMGIRCGMRGVAGAIDDVRFDGDSLRISVLGGGPARGITGSGLFSLIGELLRSGRLDSFGAMQTSLFPEGRLRRGEGGNEIILAPGITVSEHDIQQFLLAKAATRAAVDTLLAGTRVKPEDVTAFYLAGTFAGKIAPPDIRSVGLIPAGTAYGVGNAAAVGAAMMAASESAFQEACYCAGTVRHFALSESRAFMDAFQSAVHF